MVFNDETNNLLHQYVCSAECISYRSHLRKQFKLICDGMVYKSPEEYFEPIMQMLGSENQCKSA